jgi:ABC-type bacteriocin/lantibiotic exporter with double-glycine peptidase domain
MRVRRIVPEVVQTSMMDCGPASLSAMLAGFGIPVSYGRLREACQTDVDGTSIDTIEDIANQLGLEAEQIMVPPDHVTLPSAQSLPAIAVVMQPDGLPHFVVVWGRAGSRVQLMDPATGRRWPTCAQFIASLYVHRHTMEAELWAEWAASDGFLDPLCDRMVRIGVPDGDARRWAREAADRDAVVAVSTLDAGTRFVARLVDAKAVSRGNRAVELLRGLTAKTSNETRSPIPDPDWFALPMRTEPDQEPLVLLQGAVLVRATGVQTAAERASLLPEVGERADTSQPPPLSPDLVAALQEAPTRPAATLWRVFRSDGTLLPMILLSALVPAAAGVIVQAVLFRALLDLPFFLGPPEQRMGTAGAVLVFLVALLLLELPIAVGLLRIGRFMETRLRIMFLEKVPRLGDRYFHSRPTSDMAERLHQTHVLRSLPAEAAGFARAVLTLVFTTLGIIWLDPSTAVPAMVVAFVAIALPLALQPLLAERDLRVRTHSGALARFYLDGLLGLVAIRNHGAQNALRTEHEGLAVEWVRAGRAMLRASVAVDAVLWFAGLGLAGLLLLLHIRHVSETSTVLLLAYWALQLPAIGGEVADRARSYPAIRNITLRLLEPIGTPDDSEASVASNEDANREESSGESAATVSPGMALRFENVSVVASGNPILQEIDIDIPAGVHVGIVGPSGAGKSSLVGLLLGWHRAISGQIFIDGTPLERVGLPAIRQQTAWVDPSVQLWNRSLLQNLSYGSTSDPLASMADLFDKADLRGVMECLPDGLQTSLGEGGGFLSGGEGQRVRLARAALRRNARLVIFDEAFRGLEADRRQSLLARMREHWKHSTMLCITHDVTDTLALDLVLVVRDGRVVESGTPDELVRDPDSFYSQLVAANRKVYERVWSHPAWRRVRIERGRLHERKSGDAS